MPHYRCPACCVTTHSVGGHFRANTCPNCSAPLTASDRISIRALPPQVVSCELAAEPEAASAARCVLATLLPDPDDAVSQIAALLTSELIANSVEHSGAPQLSPVRLDIAVTDERVRVEIRDQGEGFVYLGRAPDSPLDSHWGLHLVDRLASSWGADPEPEGPIWFELDRVAVVPAATAEIVEMSTTMPASAVGGEYVH
jgi:anti-sigma regulatory factor (Ser/Thr protein kinase)